MLVDLFAYACLSRLSHVLQSNGNLPSTRLREETTFMRRPRINSLGEGMSGLTMNSWKVAIGLDMNVTQQLPKVEYTVLSLNMPQSIEGIKP